MPSPTDTSRELLILEKIETDPDVTQADMAEALGVAVGTVNFAVRRLITKGYVRVKQLERRRLKYIITPAGIALRTKLAMESLSYGMKLYRETRAEAKRLLKKVKQNGYQRIAIRGQGDLADIAQLTCLELGLTPVMEAADLPQLVIVGTTLTLELPSRVPPTQ